jgi:hypothetical protein
LISLLLVNSQKQVITCDNSANSRQFICSTVLVFVCSSVLLFYEFPTEYIV